MAQVRQPDLRPCNKWSMVLLALVLEKYLALSSYLEDASLICSDAEQPLVRLFERLLEEVNRRDIHAAWRILNLLPQDRLTHEQVEDEQQAMNSLISARSRLDIITWKTELFPRQRPVVQVYDFLYRSFPLLKDRELLLAVVLWPVYNFGQEPDFIERLLRSLDSGVEEPPRIGVLYLAEIERDNPLAWCLLAHEVGHAIDEAENITYTILGTWEPLELKQLPAWVRELVADMIALRVMGPAYFCASAVQALLAERPTRYYPSHPAFHKRIDILKAELEASKAIESNANNTCRKSESLCQLLSEGIPPSSFVDVAERYGEINTGARDLLVALKRAVARRRRATVAPPEDTLGRLRTRLDDLLKTFVEHPTEPVEVLNAGWLCRWQEMQDWCSTRGGLEEWRRPIQRLAALLWKSIGTASVHRNLQQVDDDSQRIANP